MLNKEHNTEKKYYVTYDLSDYDYEHTVVYAHNKWEVKRIMKHQYGTNVIIRDIEVSKYDR